MYYLWTKFFLFCKGFCRSFWACTDTKSAIWLATTRPTNTIATATTKPRWVKKCLTFDVWTGSRGRRSPSCSSTQNIRRPRQTGTSQSSDSRSKLFHTKNPKEWVNFSKKKSQRMSKLVNNKKSKRMRVCCRPADLWRPNVAVVCLPPVKSNAWKDWTRKDMLVQVYCKPGFSWFSVVQKVSLDRVWGWRNTRTHETEAKTGSTPAMWWNWLWRWARCCWLNIQMSDGNI